MYVPFNELPANAKVWLYPCTEILSETQMNDIQQDLKAFVDEWLSHSRKIKGSSSIFANRILCLAADQESFTVGGCSIDSATRFLKTLEDKYNIKCFARSLIIYKENDEIQAVDFHTIDALTKSKEISEDVLVFNLQATTIGELENQWIPLKESPYANFIS